MSCSIVEIVEGAYEEEDNDDGDGDGVGDDKVAPYCDGTGGGRTSEGDGGATLAELEPAGEDDESAGHEDDDNDEAVAAAASARR